jgi:predicted nucleic acid-binding protein
VSDACVIDASVSVAWCFIDEATPAAMQLLARLQSAEAWVPGLWRSEVASVLLAAERRRRITRELVAEFLAIIAGLSIRVDAEADYRAHGPVLSLARAHQLTVYDALYLDVAVRRQLPLATRDRALVNAARATMVPLIET